MSSETTGTGWDFPVLTRVEVAVSIVDHLHNVPDAFCNEVRGEAQLYQQAHMAVSQVMDAYTGYLGLFSTPLDISPEQTIVKVNSRPAGCSPYILSVYAWISCMTVAGIDIHLTLFCVFGGPEIPPPLLAWNVFVILIVFISSTYWMKLLYWSSVQKFIECLGLPMFPALGQGSDGRS